MNILAEKFNNRKAIRRKTDDNTYILLHCCFRVNYALMLSRLEKKCAESGLKMTDQRKIIIKVLSESGDHPDVEMIYQRAHDIDSKISIATVYRTMRLFQEAGIIEKHDFGDGRARYEETGSEHHDHLIDMKSGKVIEFSNEEIEKLQRVVAEKLGYKIVDHRLELYCVPMEDKKTEA